MTTLAELLHEEIFIADGGVDDHETLTDREKKKIVYRWLQDMLGDEEFLSAVARCPEGES